MVEVHGPTLVYSMGAHASCIVLLYGYFVAPAEPRGDMPVVWQWVTQPPRLREVPRKLDLLEGSAAGGMDSWLKARVILGRG